MQKNNKNITKERIFTAKAWERMGNCMAEKWNCSNKHKTLKNDSISEQKLSENVCNVMK